MTVQGIVLHLLSYIGIRDLDPTKNTLTSHPGISSGGVGAYGDIQFALNKLNMAMQQVFREGPESISTRPGGGLLKPPRNVTIAVTQYSPTVVVTGWESDMVGCTVEISGSLGGMNSFLSATKLSSPVSNSTGTVSAVVYHDALLVGSDVRAVIEPIELPTFDPELVVVTTRRGFDCFNTGYTGTEKRVAQPRAVFLDAIYNAALPIKLIRFNPLPDQMYAVKWYEKVDPIPYVLEDVIASGDESTGPFTDPNKILPLHWVESVLLPIATELFMSHPSFENPSASQAIVKEAAIARSIMLPDEIVSRSASTAQYLNNIPCR